MSSIFSWVSFFPFDLELDFLGFAFPLMLDVEDGPCRGGSTWFGKYSAGVHD